MAKVIAAIICLLLSVAVFLGVTTFFGSSFFTTVAAIATTTCLNFYIIHKAEKYV